MTREEREELAELRGHVHIHCRACGYRGYSDDCGGCPKCEPEEEEEEQIDGDRSGGHVQ